MEVLKISAFAIISLVLIVLIKEEKKEIGVLCSITATVVLAIYAIVKLNDIVDLLNNLISKSGINTKYLEIVLKVVGLAYIIEFTKDICVDSGETALGNKVEVAGKILITVITIPMITSIVEVINKLI